MSSRTSSRRPPASTASSIPSSRPSSSSRTRCPSRPRSRARGSSGARRCACPSARWNPQAAPSFRRPWPASGAEPAMPLKILLNGARGRMGAAVAAAAPGMGVIVAAAADQGDDLGASIGTVDAVVDFSSASATGELLRLAAAHGKPVVIGTTGHSPAEKKRLLRLAAKVPCVWSGNFSVGVNLLYALTRRASRALGDDFDAEVMEMHHRMKDDAPSGTAARLIEIIMEERKLDRGALRHGREGITGARKQAEIGVD